MLCAISPLSTFVFDSLLFLALLSLSWQAFTTPIHFLLGLLLSYSSMISSDPSFKRHPYASLFFWITSITSSFHHSLSLIVSLPMNASLKCLHFYIHYPFVFFLYFLHFSYPIISYYSFRLSHGFLSIHVCYSNITFSILSPPNIDQRPSGVPLNTSHLESFLKCFPSCISSPMTTSIPGLG